jgi:hypothetical protein
VAAVLESLGRKRTSGVLEVDGNPAGAIYLDRGQVTFARASWVPDLTARLCGVLQPAPELRHLLRGGDQADRDIGTMLVERGYMDRGELQAVLRSALIDALLALTTPQAGGSSVSDIRFEAPGVHWAAAFVRLPLETVEAEVSHRAEQMARAGVAHTVPIALADLDRGPAFLTRDQWAIACRVNGSLTPRDLARQSGLALYDTVTALGILLRRGFCTLATPVAPIPRSHRAGSSPRPPEAPVPPPRETAAPLAAASSHQPSAGPASVPAEATLLSGPQRPPGPRIPAAPVSSPAAAGTTPGPADVPRPVPAWTTRARAPEPADPGRPVPARPPATRTPSGPLPAAAGLSAASPSSFDGGDPSPLSAPAHPSGPFPAANGDGAAPSFPASAGLSVPPDLESRATTDSGPLAIRGPRFRPHGASSPDVPPPPGPRYPGDGPSEPPVDLPRPRATVSQDDLTPPRDVPSWDEAWPARDTEPPRPADRGVVWSATSGPAAMPAPRPATRPEPPEAQVLPVRRQPSFTPIVTPTPLAAPDLAVPDLAAPAAQVRPASADVPIVRPSRRLPPAHPGYRRPPRPEWSTAAPPVPSAVLAAPAAMNGDSGSGRPDPDEPPAQRRPVLPRRDPGAGLVQPLRNATEPLPIPARDWREPDRADPAEAEAYVASGPDLLRRVLDGLRRLT